MRPDVRRLAASDTAYVFDVDGTLTESSRSLAPEHRGVLERFCSRFHTFLVSGSDFEKTRSQIGDLIVGPIRGSFNCSGNSFHVGGRSVYETAFTLTDELEQFLLQLLAGSRFPVRAGNHIDRRSGLLNFSIPGRSADFDVRRQYIDWDGETGERERLARAVNERFEGRFEASVAGETGIDICEPGRDKRQVFDIIKQPFRSRDPEYLHEGYRRIVFFGDKCERGGNDYPLVERLDRSIDSCHNVSSVNETYEILKDLLGET